jgi:hypothetical protein
MDLYPIGPETKDLFISHDGADDNGAGAGQLNRAPRLARRPTPRSTARRFFVDIPNIPVMLSCSTQAITAQIAK